MMKIALSTDFLRSTGSPERALRSIAQAGFTHLHWCHQWCTDFLYGKHEIRAYARMLRENGLKLLDIHGSAGREKNWFSLEEYERRAGVELVENRLEMLSELEGEGVLMMHAPYIGKDFTPEQREAAGLRLDSLRRSLDELMPRLEKLGLLIALENMPGDTFEYIRTLLEEYPESRLGITYDSGHGNIAEGMGMDFLAPLRGRLQALHLHDNDGSGDQHRAPFTGTVDWERMVRMIVDSSYVNRPASFELSMRGSPYFEPELENEQKEETVRAYLSDAYTRCARIAEMLESARRQHARDRETI